MQSAIGRNFAFSVWFFWNGITFGFGKCFVQSQNVFLFEPMAFSLTGNPGILPTTAHDAVNWKQLADWAELIVDTHNAMAGIKTADGKA